jgi:hypothetical protein
MRGVITDGKVVDDALPMLATVLCFQGIVSSSSLAIGDVRAGRRQGPKWEIASAFLGYAIGPNISLALDLDTWFLGHNLPVICPKRGFHDLIRLFLTASRQSTARCAAARSAHGFTGTAYLTANVGSI